MNLSKRLPPPTTHALLDFRFSDFTVRHVFTAKLRLVIIVGFWVFISVVSPWVLTLDQPIMLIISLTFVLTTICYFFILRGIAPVFFFILELVADVAAQTVLVYLTGGAKSNFFTIYIIYCASGGLFYNYRVSWVISIIILVFYSSLLLATHFGWIAEFASPIVTQQGLFSTLGPLQNLAFLIIFLLVAIYGIWLASYFTKVREKALEEKNKELITLMQEHGMLIEELQQKNVELERVSRVKSEFLATMSHELRTPLTAIIGFSELLMEEVMGVINKEQKESLKEVLVNGENLLQMINGILDLSKIESGKMELTIDPIDLTELVARIQRMMSSLLQKKNLSFEVKMDPSFPVFHLDEKKIQQVLLNLLSNAIKFTPKGGKICVTVSYQQKEREKRLRVSVSDTGIGIDPKHQKGIFESFQQIDSSYTREFQGTGLGLALVKKFIDLHGGKIWVESEVGKGAMFVFEVPDLK